MQARSEAKKWKEEGGWILIMRASKANQIGREKREKDQKQA